MNTQRFDALALTQMASGHLCLNLTEKIHWEDFPDYADTVLRFINGNVKQRCDATEIRLWHVEIHGCTMRLVFDDYPTMVTLESSDNQGDLILKTLYQDFGNL